MLIVDNYIYSFALNLENGICIKPYYEGKEDDELVFLTETLEKGIMGQNRHRHDLRDVVGSEFGMKGFYKYLGYSGK